MANFITNATDGTDLILGTTDQDIIVGNRGDDYLYGSINASVDGGHDVIFGGYKVVSSRADAEAHMKQLEEQKIKTLDHLMDEGKIKTLPDKDYFTYEVPNDGIDVIGVGDELHSPNFSGKIDDIAFSGSGTDYLFGMGRRNAEYFEVDSTAPKGFGGISLNSWSDDSKSVLNIRRDLLAGVLNGHKTDLNSDVLIGGTGQDLYVMGFLDTIIERKPQNDVIYAGGGVSSATGQIQRINPSWKKMHSYSLGSDVFYYNSNPEPKGDRVNTFPQQLSDSSFANGNRIFTYKLINNSDERQSERSKSYYEITVHFPGIIQNDQGDVAFLFPEGAVIFLGGTDQDGFIFVHANETGQVIAGDFGFEFPQLQGFEANSNYYVIGYGQWLLDLEEAVERELPGMGKQVADSAQDWLLYTIYPLVDPFRKALAGTDQVLYPFYNEDGTLNGMQYDSNGNVCTPSTCSWGNNVVSQAVPPSLQSQMSLSNLIPVAHAMELPFLGILGMTMLLRLFSWRKRQ